MSSTEHPEHDPGDDAVRSPLSETGRDQVRALIDSVVQTAAPRLGKTAVARIAKPLTEALTALHEHQRGEANGWRAVGEALDATTPSDAASVLGRARQVMAMLNVLGGTPVEVGEVITTAERLAQAPLGTVLRDADGVLFERFRDPAEQPGRWYSPGTVGAYDLTLPARVLDLGGSA